jgi:hypothetical protein
MLILFCGKEFFIAAKPYLKDVNLMGLREYMTRGPDSSGYPFLMLRSY